MKATEEWKNNLEFSSLDNMHYAVNFVK